MINIIGKFTLGAAHKITSGAHLFSENNFWPQINSKEIFPQYLKNTYYVSYS